MEPNKKIVLAILILILGYMVGYEVYYWFHVSSPQFSNFKGNAESIDFIGQNYSSVHFKAGGVFFHTNETVYFNHVKNITIESNNGDLRLINYSSLQVRYTEDISESLSNVDINILFENLTMDKKFANFVYLSGYMNNMELKSNGEEVIIQRPWVDTVIIGVEKLADFSSISFEMDNTSSVESHGGIIKLGAFAPSDLIISSEQPSKIILKYGEGELGLNSHKFEVRIADFLDIDLLPNYQSHLYIEGTRLTFDGVTDSAKLNNENKIMSEVSYWFNIKPEALFSGINAFAVVILVIITWWYAREVRRQTKLTEKDKMRRRILEVIQDVLTPYMHSLENEIKAIQSSKIWWHRHKSERSYFQEGISKLLSDTKKDSAAFRDLIEKFPDLEKKFQSHDTLYDKLNDLYAKVEGEVKTSELPEHLKFLKNEFNKSKDDTHRLKGVFLDEPDRVFVYYIINFRNPRERLEDTIQPEIDFWEKYKDNLLLKFRNTPRIKQFDVEIEDALMQLKNLNEDLLRRMKEIREGYRKEYHFTKYEIDPGLKPKW